MSLFRLCPSAYSDEEWQNEIDSVRALILGRSQPTSIVVFGSSVVGERTAESDMDIAVFYETEEQAARASTAILAGSPFRTIPVDLAVFSSDRFLASASRGGVASEIQRTGKVIYGCPPWQRRGNDDAKK